MKHVSFPLPLISKDATDNDSLAADVACKFMVSCPSKPDLIASGAGHWFGEVTTCRVSTSELLSKVNMETLFYGLQTCMADIGRFPIVSRLERIERVHCLAGARQIHQAVSAL